MGAGYSRRRSIEIPSASPLLDEIPSAPSASPLLDEIPSAPSASPLLD